MVNQSALCELGLLPAVCPLKDVGDVVWLMQGRSLAKMETNDNRTLTANNGICWCSRKIRQPEAVVAYKLVQRVDNSSKYDEDHHYKDVKCKRDRQYKEIRGKENEWLQEVEEVGCKKKIVCKYLPMEDRKGIVDNVRRERRYFMAVARGLSSIMVCGSILSFVVLKLQEEKRKIHLDAVYMAGAGNMVSDE